MSGNPLNELMLIFLQGGIITIFFTDLNKEMIRISESMGYTTLKNEFLKEERDNDRVLIFSRDLGEELWDRVKHIVFEHPGLQNVKPFGFYSEGKWHASGINPCFRFNIFRLQRLI